MTHDPSAGGLPSARPIYILDTSVLYEYLKGKAGFGEAPAGNPRLWQAIDQLFCDGRHELVVPHIVLMEMVSQFFQCSIDLTNYAQWYRKRYIAFSRIPAALFSPRSNSKLLADVPRMSAINHACQQISANVIVQLAEKYRKCPPRNLREPKFLDGMDAQILDEAAKIACSSPGRCCYLISGDMHFEIAVDDLRARAASDPQLPGNLYFKKIWHLPSLLWPRRRNP